MRGGVCGEVRRDEGETKARRRRGRGEARPQRIARPHAIALGPSARSRGGMLRRAEEGTFEGQRCQRGRVLCCEGKGARSARCRAVPTEAEKGDEGPRRGKPTAQGGGSGRLSEAEGEPAGAGKGGRRRGGHGPGTGCADPTRAQDCRAHRPNSAEAFNEAEGRGALLRRARGRRKYRRCEGRAGPTSEERPTKDEKDREREGRRLTKHRRGGVWILDGLGGLPQVLAERGGKEGGGRRSWKGGGRRRRVVGKGRVKTKFRAPEVALSEPKRPKRLSVGRDAAAAAAAVAACGWKDNSAACLKRTTCWRPSRPLSWAPCWRPASAACFFADAPVRAGCADRRWGGVRLFCGLLWGARSDSAPAFQP